MPLPARRSLPAAFLVGLLVLAVQAFLAVSHATSGARLVYYTPYAVPTVYRLNVSVAGRALTDAQIRERYGIPFRGQIALTPRALQQIVIRREGDAAAVRDTVVRMHVSSRGGPEEIWLWPQQ